MPADLVVFGEDWGTLPTSTQHLARHLARDRRILYVNSLGLRRPRFNAYDLKRVVDKAGQAIRGRRGDVAANVKVKPPENMTVAAPLALPFPGSQTALKINSSLVARQLVPKLKELGFDRPILWVSSPTGFVAAGTLDERAIVYYCSDDWGSLAGVDHEDVLAIEKRLVARADLIMACSTELYAKFPPEKTELILHGVDYDLFAEPAPRADDLPDGGPIAGFYGSIAAWINVEMLAQVAQRLPQWTFVFIGRVSAGVDVSPLEAQANVRFLGPRPHSELPRYVQHWDVSMLPFRKSPQIEACNPLKLREYFAAGTPIASLMFPALQPYADLVFTGETAAEFEAAILAAGQDTARNGERRARVAHETWADRAAQASRAMARFDEAVAV